MPVGGAARPRGANARRRFLQPPRSASNSQRELMERKKPPVDNPFGDVIGIRITGAADGSARSELRVEPRLLNPHGVLHGGVVFSMADNTMGAALYTELSEGETCSTIEIKINFTRPVSAGLLLCQSTVIHRGRTTAVLEATVSNDQKLVARAQGTFAVLQR